MNEYLLDAEIGGIGRVVGDLGRTADDADRRVWAEANEVLRERVYEGVRVIAEWPARDDADTVRLPLTMIGAENGHDAESIAELFLYDAFLLFNLAAPGSLGGTVSLSTRNELTVNAWVFEYAWVSALRNREPRIEPLPLRDVVAWYDGDGDMPAKEALLHLLHLARGPEDEVLSIVRLAQAAQRLGTGDAKLFELRERIARGDVPVSHPLSDDEDASLEWIDAADRGASAVVSALQQRVRGRA